MPPPESFEVEVVANEALAPTVRGLVLSRVGGAPLVYAPGQWVSLALPSPAGPIRRSYSIASAPDGSPRFELAVTRVAGGVGSAFLCDAAPGTRVAATGPQGFFTREATNPAPALFVATGTGLAPLRAMLHAALRAGSTAPMRVLVGVRHEVDRLYAEELAALAGTHPNLCVAYTLSRPTASWTGLSGYVQQHVPAAWAELGALGQGTPHAWICGLSRMVVTVRDVLRSALGAERAQVHSERYD